MFNKSQPTRGLTILELLVTMSFIGIVVVVLLPAIGMARESSRRVTCANNMRELGLALHRHHTTKSCFPAGWQFEPSGDTAYGWAVPLLPYLAVPDLHDAIDTELAIGDSKNRMARETVITQLLCPSDFVEPSFVLFGSDGDTCNCRERIGSALRWRDSNRIPLLRLPTSNYLGVYGSVEPVDDRPLIGQCQAVGDGAFRGDATVRLRDFSRGLSHTFLSGERKMAQASSTWYGIDTRGENAFARLVGATLDGINQPLGEECDFSSRHPDGAYFLYGDGHVKFVTERIELRLYREQARLRPNG